MINLPLSVGLLRCAGPGHGANNIIICKHSRVIREERRQAGSVMSPPQPLINITTAGLPAVRSGTSFIPSLGTRDGEYDTNVATKDYKIVGYEETTSLISLTDNLLKF